MSSTDTMPVANRLENVEFVPAAAPQANARKIFTSVSIFDGQRWLSLCPELDIASEGDSVNEAFANLRAAVQEAIQVAQERGIEAGRPAPEAEVLAFLQAHRTGDQPVRGQQFIV
jgi:predicted RNase H-like HicB family nuclease